MNSNEVVEKIDFERGRVVKELRNKMNQAKFDLLKQYLINEKIEVPEDIKTSDKLMSYAKKKMSREQYQFVKKQKKDMEKDVEVMLNDLSKGSTTAFSGKFKDIMDKTKGVGLAVLEPMALAALLNIVTPPPLKIFSSAAILGRSGYKLVKNHNKRRIANEAYGLSKIIRELEVKKDSKGKIIDTRFSPSMQEKIREFLKEKKVSFEDTGYISLMNAIYSLDLDVKRELCHFINNNLGNTLYIPKELKKYKNSFFDFSTIPYMTGVGLTLSNTVNNMPIVQEALSGLITGTAVGTVTENAVTGAVAGIGKGSLNVVADVFNIDWLQDFLQTYDSAVNTLTITTGFVALGAVGSIGASLWNYVRGKKIRYENTLENQKISKIDKVMYAKDNEIEQEKIRKNMMENPKIADVMIVSLVYEYIKRKGIEIPNDIKDANQLTTFIKKLNVSQRADIGKFYKDLKYYNTHNHGEFMRKTGKFFNAVKDVATVGLAGLSLYDIFIDHEFLEKTNQVFTDKVEDTLGIKSEVVDTSSVVVDDVVVEPLEVVEVKNEEFDIVRNFRNKTVTKPDDSQFKEARRQIDSFYDSEVYDTSVGWDYYSPMFGKTNNLASIDSWNALESIQGYENNEIYWLFSSISSNEYMVTEEKTELIKRLLSSLETKELGEFVDFYNSISQGEPFNMPGSSDYNIPYFWPSNFSNHENTGLILEEVVKLRKDSLPAESFTAAVATVSATGEAAETEINEVTGRKIGIITPAAAVDSLVNLGSLHTEKESKRAKTNFERKKKALEAVRNHLSNVPITPVINDTVENVSGFTR